VALAGLIGGWLFDCFGIMGGIFTTLWARQRREQSFWSAFRGCSAANRRSKAISFPAPPLTPLLCDTIFFRTVELTFR